MFAFPPSKKRQLKDFKETIDVLETDLSKPLALVFDRGQDVFLFYRADYNKSPKRFRVI
jgi:hypothetical protein